MRSKFGNILWGLVIIFLGIGFAGEAFNLWHFELFFKGWWTVFIIVPCFVSMIQNRVNVVNTFGVLIGILLLLTERGIITYTSIRKVILPLVLIYIGLFIIYREVFKKKPKLSKNTKFGKDGFVNILAIFSGQEIKPFNEKFNGGTITSVFGGTELNLTNAIISEDIIVKTVCVFGGADIILPRNVKVKVSSIPLFGGVSNKVDPPVGENWPTVYIDAISVFGGVNLKN